MSSNYDLLVLDYGGVYSFEYNPLAQDTIMQKTFGRTPTIDEYKLIDGFSSQLAANKISSPDYVALVARVLGVATPDYTFFEDMTISVTHDPTPDMKAFVEEMRSFGLVVSLLSDMYLFEVIKTKPWGRYDGFSFVSLSAEIGATKHEFEAFEHTLRHFSVRPERVLFVDDKKSNILTAEKMGIHCLWVDKVRYKSAENLIRDIKNRL